MLLWNNYIGAKIWKYGVKCKSFIDFFAFLPLFFVKHNDIAYLCVRVNVKNTIR